MVKKWPLLVDLGDDTDPQLQAIKSSSCRDFDTVETNGLKWLGLFQKSIQGMTGTFLDNPLLTSHFIIMTEIIDSCFYGTGGYLI